MNILFVSAILPYPLYSGGQVRIYNLLKRLSRKHTITLLAFIREDSERNYAKDLNFLSGIKMILRGKALQLKYLVRAFGMNPVKIDRYPLLLETYNNEEMKELISNELQDHAYDLVHIEPFYVYPSLPQLSIPLIISEHNIEYEVYDAYARSYPMPLLRPVLIRDAKRIRFWEEKSWVSASDVIAVSENDAAIITTVRKKKTSVVQNGVDIKAFRFSKRSLSVSDASFLYVGNFAWAPNQGAVAVLLKKIWPAILSKFPNARLTVVGKQFPDNLRPFITSSVRIKSDVFDITKEYESHDILLAPMEIAGGSKYKILEAMACGTAVIATQAGIAGIDCTFGIHAMQAETPQDFVNAVESVYQSPEHTIVMTKQARNLIEDKYNWDTIAKELDSVWKKAK
jgi:glycosyltransferase involved in cell wall biosynthesis